MEQHKKVVLREITCRHCDEVVLQGGEQVKRLAREAIDSMPANAAWEIVLESKPMPLVRCAKCSQRTNLLGAVRVTTTRPNPHPCPCCGTTVHAMREVDVAYYG